MAGRTGYDMVRRAGDNRMVVFQIQAGLRDEAEYFFERDIGVDRRALSFSKLGGWIVRYRTTYVACPRYYGFYVEGARVSRMFHYSCVSPFFAFFERT